MKATAIEVTELRATVRLRPCWLARLLGARTTTVELEWRERLGYSRCDWHLAASRRPLDDAPHRSAIRDALDFRPVEKLPRAVLR